MVKDYGQILEKSFSIAKKVKPSRDYIEKIHNQKKKLIKTGLSFIDEGITGLLETDLLIIGAATNVGKTDIAKIIAVNNAYKGVKTSLFALESYQGEIEDRLKWHKMLNLKQRLGINKFIGYGQWVSGQYSGDEDILKLEEKAIEEIDQRIKDNLYTRYREPNETYTVDLFCQEIDLLQQKEYKSELIVVDHLHYFSKTMDNENQDIENIIKKLKDVSMLHKIPVIVFSHFRKKTMLTSKIPDIDEFHGSSEISKRATALVTISPALDMPRKNDNTFPTYFRIGKEKMKTGAARYAVCVNYNIIHGDYETQYDIYNYSGDGSISKINGKRPFYATSGSIGEVPEVSTRKKATKNFN